MSRATDNSTATDPGETAARRSAQPVQQPRLATEPAGSQPTIMIVDDETVNIYVTQKYLSLAGYDRFVTTTDASTVAHLARQDPPDIVLLDVMMPGVSGLEVLEQLRSDKRTAHTPVIILTASSDQSVKQIALELGATDFITKPVDASDLVPRVRNALAMKAHQDRLKNYSDALEREILQRTQIETELKSAKHAAEDGNRSKSEFLANMSHEIRTPMTAILGYADVLMSEGNYDAAPPNQRRALEAIKRNGEYLLELINDILDLSKIEAGKLDVECIKCSPAQLMADVLRLMSVRAEAKDVQLLGHVEEPVPEAICSDPTRLRQILINLVGNAIKFTERGEVRVIVRHVSDTEGPPTLQFDTVDTGIGMSREQMDRLFRPFAQADTSTTRRFGGTGLGLTITKRLVEILGGTIEVESEKGKGSRFRVSVPVVPVADEAVEETASVETSHIVHDHTQPAPTLDGTRVLFAEDGPDNQRLVSFFLEKAGADVVVVENGKLAVEAALKANDEGAPFDVILMDMQMPVQDGYSATRTLRESAYFGPIIALTAHAMQSDRKKCLSAGCTDYMTKPVDRRALLEIVARYAQIVSKQID